MKEAWEKIESEETGPKSRIRFGENVGNTFPEYGVDGSEDYLLEVFVDHGNGEVDIDLSLFWSSVKDLSEEEEKTKALEFCKDKLGLLVKRIESYLEGEKAKGSM